MKYKAFIVEEMENGSFRRYIGEKQTEDLPDGDILVKVHYSSLNYKDALSATGNKGVTRRYPHTPGIDATGEVVECRDGSFSPGDKVLITGFDLGMNTPGGFGQYIRIPSKWAIPLPDTITTWEAMAIGTGGFTGALSVMKLIQAGAHPDNGEILVTGASGGVGSYAALILKKEGYNVTALTYKGQNRDFLERIGISRILEPEELKMDGSKALLSSTWAGVIDALGGPVLVSALKATKFGGIVTCCGNVLGPDLGNLTVYPFILRGVTLIGIASAESPRELKSMVWQKLATTWKPVELWEKIREITLNELEGSITEMLEGRSSGRIVVNVRDS
jgi:putative YhdH/YhfP family quinone oxidoreductase